MKYQTQVPSSVLRLILFIIINKDGGGGRGEYASEFGFISNELLMKTKQKTYIHKTIRIEMWSIF